MKKVSEEKGEEDSRREKEIRSVRDDITYK
jgi:hypothetical protein